MIGDIKKSVKVPSVEFKKPRTVSKFRKLIAPLTVIVGIFLIYYLWSQFRLYRDPEAIVEKETIELVNKVSEHMVLPLGELPSVATVTDPEALKADHPFFTSASKGDKVLIYSKAKRAILYSVKLDKIVDIATINVTTP
ncbi:MAG: hypothetical protein WCT29_00095 [Candidatus Paceibacterota bacterium]|jgi:hypothetical protein